LLAIPAAVIARSTDGRWPALRSLSESDRLSNNRWALALLLPSLAYGVGEEIGWRGFALPRLQARLDALPAGIVLGLIWVVWHAPFFLYRENMVDTTMGAKAAQGIVIIIGGLFLAWLYNSTRGSILLCALFHFTNSVVHIALPEVSESWDTNTGVLVTVLALLVTALWWRTMSTGSTHIYRQPGTINKNTAESQTDTS
jgi:membrane protease YdiL (CAAX protease family)